MDRPEGGIARRLQERSQLQMGLAHPQHGANEREGNRQEGERTIKAIEHQLQVTIPDDALAQREARPKVLGIPARKF
jgi:hypothetical protein